MPRFGVGKTGGMCFRFPSAMNQPVSAFPDSPEDIVESLELKYRADPVNEEHDRQVGNDEIITQDNVEIQVMGHNFSF